eukprot:291174_1
MESSELPRRLTDLWAIGSDKRAKAIKLVSKIFAKILSNPQEPKFQDLNFQKLRNKFQYCRPGFYLLYEAGFKQSMDGSRLIWKYSNDNYILLKKVNDALQAKLKEPNVAKPNKVNAKPVANEWEGTNYRRQIQQRMKREESTKEQKRKLIKEKIAMQRKEQQIEQKRLMQNIKEKKERRKQMAQSFIKEQMVNGMNEIMQQMLKSLAPTQDDIDTEHKSDDCGQMHDMPSQYKASYSSGIYGSYICWPQISQSRANVVMYDEGIVNKLSDLGIATREQLIKASELADNYKDEFSVVEALQSLFETD